jgi:hypothetical protein
MTEMTAEEMDSTESRPVRGLDLDRVMETGSASIVLVDRNEQIKR